MTRLSAAVAESQYLGEGGMQQRRPLSSTILLERSTKRAASVAHIILPSRVCAMHKHTPSCPLLGITLAVAWAEPPRTPSDSPCWTSRRHTPCPASSRAEHSFDAYNYTRRSPPSYTISCQNDQPAPQMLQDGSVHMGQEERAFSEQSTW
jgi:hypothetical protein